MALPQKAIEHLAREPVRTPGWSGGVLMFTGAILFLSVAIYIGTKFGYVAHLTRQANDLQNQMNLFTQKIPEERQQEIILFNSQLVNLRQLLDKRRFASHAFPWLQEHTQRNVQFTSFDLNAAQGTLKVDAVARDVADVAQQVVSLEDIPEIINMKFSGASFNKDDNNWSFSLELTLDPRIFVTSPTPSS